MISRRDKLLNYPWQVQRYEAHREKLHSARPAIDDRCPPIYPHILTKPKKMQTEKERRHKIEEENLRLLKSLGSIMQTKRLKDFWEHPRPNFLSREKLFETRPYSSLPKLIAVYAPSLDYEPKSPNIKTKHRCPTCCGCPELTIVRIPEARSPWAPERKSWNAKTKAEETPNRCYHCGHITKD